MSQTSHLKLLWAARRKMWRNQLTRQPLAARALLLASLTLLPVASAAAGWFTAPWLAARAQAPLPPGQVQPAGGPWVAMGFWISVLGVMFLSFRVMEVLYRKQDARLLSSWPLRLQDLFLYRLVMSLGEAAAGALLTSAFFAGLWAASQEPRALAAGLLCAAGLLLSTLLGFATQLYAGVLNFLDADERSPLQSNAMRDAGGGMAAAFLFSPGAAMLGSIALLLVMKLAGADEFFARGASRLFWLGLGIPAAVGVASLVLARRWFIQHYPRLLARFYESDLVQFDSGYKYHQSAAAGRQGLVERLLPARLLPLYRKDSLQLARRHPLQRALLLVLWGGSLALCWGGARLPLLVASLPLLYLAALAAPFARLYHHDLEPGMQRHLPISEADAHQARAVVTLREALTASLPCALLLIWPGGHPLEAALALALAPAASLPLLEAARRAGPGASRLLGAVLSAALLLWTAQGALP